MPQQQHAGTDQADAQTPPMDYSMARVQRGSADSNAQDSLYLLSSGHGDMVRASECIASILGPSLHHLKLLMLKNVNDMTVRRGCCAGLAEYTRLWNYALFFSEGYEGRWNPLLYRRRLADWSRCNIT